jgi:DNA-binding transcriptional ArsR family regulator
MGGMSDYALMIEEGRRLDPGYPTEENWKAQSTSRDAARAAKSTAATIRQQILDALAKRPDGRTPDELALILGLSILAVRPRVSELNKLELIVKTGERRANESGLMANCWRLK